MITNNERFYFTAKGLPDVKFYVVSFTGTERINEGFSFKIHLVTKELSIDSDALIFQQCIFSIQREKGVRVVYSGRAKEISFEKILKGFAFITIEFAPNIFFMDAFRQSRIYLDKSLPDLIENILCSSHYTILPHEIRFVRKYPVQEFSMQYNETLYNFLRYKLEEQGAYFFFDESGEKIIFADNPLAHPKSIGILRYTPESGLLPESKEEILTSFTVSVHPIPGKVIVRNYDWKDPNKIIVGVKDTIKKTSLVSDAEILNDEAVSSQDEANRIAGIRAEELRCQRVIGKGTSHAPQLHPGVVFTIDNYPNQAFNGDSMITEITHEGSQKAYISQMLSLPVKKEVGEHYFYRNSFTCIKADCIFHPERKTPRSIISGMLNAFIDGDDPNTPVLDSYGRYKVIFPFDLSGRSSGKASCWVRKAQEQVGKDSGITFPLLPGTEVNISFINGNPDRPVITGALSNGETGSLAGPGNKSFSGIRTPGGAQLSFDNDHQGISLGGAGGSGIKLGSGSMSYLQTDTHIGLNIAAQTSSSVAGFCQSKLSGFKQSTAAVCGKWQSYLLGILSLVCGQSTNILNSLSASSSDAKTANDLSWGASSTKMASALVSFITQLYMAKNIPNAEYNVQITASKSASSQITQCFPSTAELVANMVVMLLGSLGEAGTSIADAANTVKDADSQDTGDVEAYKNILLESMRAVYDRKGFAPSRDFEKFNYQETKKTVQKENGTVAEYTVPAGDYYIEAQNFPCGYYAVTTDALASIINAVSVRIDNLAEKIQTLQISLTSPDLSKEQQKEWTAELNRELVNSQEEKNELRFMEKLSGELDKQYNNSCVGEETKADYYGYQKQKAVRNTVSNSLSALLPEIGTAIAMAIWMEQLSTKNIGGIFINAMDKNINLHAATYIGQHAGRGIYLNTLEAEMKNCGNWGSPLIAPSPAGADDNISKVFAEIKEEVLLPETENKSVTDLLNAGHINGRKGGPIGEWGDTIDKAAVTDQNTSFIAARTHLSYSKSTYEFHVADKQVTVSSPSYTIKTPQQSDSFTSLNMQTLRFDVHTSFLTLESYQEKNLKYQMRLYHRFASFGLPYLESDDSCHGIVINTNQVAVAQKNKGNKSALLLEDNKATLAIGEENHLTLDGAGNKAALSAKQVQIIDFLFESGKISGAKGGNLVLGNNDIKIIGVSSVEKVKSNINEGLQSVADSVNESVKDAEKEQQSESSDSQNNS